MHLGLIFSLMAIALMATGLFVFWIEPLWFLPILERLTPNILYRVRTSLPLVALSFDDGPHPTFTPQVLDILQRHNAKATFFLIGDRALRHPDVLAAIRAAGHEVGNHYFKDGPMLAHSDATFLRNLDQTESALNLAANPAVNPFPSFRAEREIPLPKLSGAEVNVPFPGGSPPSAGPLAYTEPSERVASKRADVDVSSPFSTFTFPFSESAKLFRPPGGLAWPRQIQLARQRGYTCVLGCAYPHDPMHPPVRYIRWLVEKNLVPGAIVILHDGISNPTRTIQALPHILEAAHKKGLRLVSISELLRASNSASL